MLVISKGALSIRTLYIAETSEGHSGVTGTSRKVEVRRGVQIPAAALQHRACSYSVANPTNTAQLLHLDRRVHLKSYLAGPKSHSQKRTEAMSSCVQAPAPSPRRRLAHRHSSSVDPLPRGLPSSSVELPWFTKNFHILRFWSIAWRAPSPFPWHR